MRNFKVLILLVTLMFQLTGVAGFNASNMNPQSQVHSVHIGTGTVNLNCDTCHGFPPVNPVQVQQNATGPGSYIVCEKCHAPLPESMKPSMGNLIVIHLSRGLYCTNCHYADNINPAHPSTRAENGTVQVIKCENCHRDAEKFTSHVNGGKYCLNCHGNKTSAASIAVTSIPVSTVSVQTVPVSTYAVPADTGKTIYTVKLDRIRVSTVS